MISTARPLKTTHHLILSVLQYILLLFVCHLFSLCLVYDCIACLYEIQILHHHSVFLLLFIRQVACVYVLCTLLRVRYLR